jgi:hypothetical protein
VAALLSEAAEWAFMLAKKTLVKAHRAFASCDPRRMITWMWLPLHVWWLHLA